MRAGFILILMVLVALPAFAQIGQDPFGQAPGQVATDPADVDDRIERVGAAAAPASVEKVPPGLVQNDDTRSLEKAIEHYNQHFNRENPDMYPYINEINERNLSLLARYQLIDRSNFDLYMNMFMVNNRVYVREEPPEERPGPDPEFDATDQNLFGALELSSQSLMNDQTRGVSDGTPVRSTPYNYRNESIWLRSMQLMYAVPIFPLPMPAKFRGKPAHPPTDYLSTLDQ